MTATPASDRDLALFLKLQTLEQGQQRLETDLQRLVPILEQILDLLATQQAPTSVPIAPYRQLYPAALPDAPEAEPPLLPDAAPSLPPQPGGWRRLFASRRTQVLLLGAVVLLGTLPWWCLNVTASAPRGLWLRSAVPPVVERDMWVTLRTPDAVKPWVPGWWPLLKQVAGVAGDEVCHRQGTLEIRGRSYGTIHVRAGGQPLPHIPEGCRRLGAGEVFLASDRPASLDSRYFSAVPLTALTAQATPLLVWR